MQSLLKRIVENQPKIRYAVVVECFFFLLLLQNKGLLCGLLNIFSCLWSLWYIILQMSCSTFRRGQQHVSLSDSWRDYTYRQKEKENVSNRPSHKPGPDHRKDQASPQRANFVPTQSELFFKLWSLFPKTGSRVHYPKQQISKCHALMYNSSEVMLTFIFGPVRLELEVCLGHKRVFSWVSESADLVLFWLHHVDFVLGWSKPFPSSE